jgi:hypothetical protein|tara:strand:- start:5269 stop:5376 length:108 start_codon:yes stop_codon:yes gene_type:complete
MIRFDNIRNWQPALAVWHMTGKPADASPDLEAWKL